MGSVPGLPEWEYYFHAAMIWTMSKIIAALIWVSTIGLAFADEPLDGLDVYVESALKDRKIPGVSVVVVKDGRVLAARVWDGYARRRISDRRHTVSVGVDHEELCRDRRRYSGRRGKTRLG